MFVEINGGTGVILYGIPHQNRGKVKREEKFTTN
jgi:hypothetical protein